jgi:REP element-mobilizing transposase RayT
MRQVATHYQRETSEINGEEDQVHFLLRYPPTVVLSSLRGAIKSQRASAALDRFGSVYWSRHSRTLWSSGFFLCWVG